MTEEYNKAMKRILPDKGIDVIEIPRKTISNYPVSASLVRKLLNEGDREMAINFIPKSSLNFL